MNKSKVSISTSNRKMGHIPSISLPPVATCHNCKGCAKKCYALRMAKRFPNIAKAWQNNLDIYKTNPDAFKLQIMGQCLTSSYFRWFVGGDIVDYNFLLLMIDIAHGVPSCKFLAFTKNYDAINKYLDDGNTIPGNLNIILSEWDKPTPNPHNLPKSKVIFKGGQEPPGAMVCGGNCYDCICKGVACWTLKNNDTIYFYEH